jgi:RNA polymerase-binding transcription factor DksA
MQAMREGEYGHCADCGADIPFERLRVEPTALRCVRCQTLFEKNFAGQQPGPTL